MWVHPALKDGNNLDYLFRFFPALFFFQQENVIYKLTIFSLKSESSSGKYSPLLTDNKVW